MKRDNIVILICLFVLYITICYPTIEKFQRMNYIQMHDYLNNEYGSGGTMRHGFDNDSMFYEGSGYSSPKNHLSTNEPRLIGYIYSQDENNNDTYELYEMHDYKRGRPGYAYKDSKFHDNTDAVLVQINPDLYNGNDLYDGDIINNVGYNNKPFVVKLYEIKKVGLGTRYSNKDYQDEMKGYGLLKPVNPGDGQLEEEDRYYILYRQVLDPRRNIYNYYIKDKRGLLIELDNQKYKDLGNGDTILIPGKERFGEYSLEIYNDDYNSWWY